MEPRIPNDFQYNYYRDRSQIPQNRRKPTKRRPNPQNSRANSKKIVRNSRETVKRITTRNPRTNSRKTVQRKLNKRKVIITLAIFLLMIMLIIKIVKKDEKIEIASNNDVTQTNTINETPVIREQEQNQNQVQTPPEVKKEITDWNLRLANSENVLPEDFKVELANIDSTRQFDARAIQYLNKMMNDMKKDKIANVWVQSAYRSVARQKELYNNSVNKYLKQGKTREEAERLTDQFIAKPGSSDHNLGLAVDFNSVDNKFEDLAAFKWLEKNAENYGFVLRFPKDKTEITKIEYESWHWRYVGEEHAKKMNELHMCLEEYIEYLQNKKTEE